MNFQPAGGYPLGTDIGLVAGRCDDPAVHEYFDVADSQLQETEFRDAWFCDSVQKRVPCS